MGWQLKIRSLVKIFTLTLICSLSIVTQAEELTFVEALQWGLTNNSSLRESSAKVAELRREIEEIEALFAWQLNLSSDLSYPTVSDFNNNLKNGSVQLTGSKKYFFGLNLQSEVDLTPTDIFRWHLNFDQQIYPSVPDKNQQEKQQIKLNLLKAEDQLSWQQTEKVIDWLEVYFALERLKNSLILAEENYQLAQTTFDQTMQKYLIQEIGQKQLLETKIELTAAEANLLQADFDFQKQKNDWYLELGLPDKAEVLIDSIEYRHGIEELIASLSWNSESWLIYTENVQENSLQLKTNKLDQQWILNQLEWSKASNKPEINLGGNYDYQSQEWSISLNLTYDLFDGGQRELNFLNNQQKLDILQIEYQQIARELVQKLQNYKNDLEVLDLKFRQKELEVEKERLEKALATEQHVQGLLIADDLERQRLNLKKAEIDLQMIYDQQLILKIRCAQLFGLELINKSNGFSLN